MLRIIETRLLLGARGPGLFALDNRSTARGVELC